MQLICTSALGSVNGKNDGKKRVSGFAFGMGVERIAMMKYGISEIGSFYAGDMRFLNQFV